MINFRLQAPQDLISRMFILDYLRKLGIDKVYNKITEDYKNKGYFYSFTDDSNKEIKDFNWEKLLFQVTLPEFEKMLEPLIKDIEELDKKEIEELLKIQEQEKIASISIYDLAQTEINKSKDKSKIIIAK